MSSKDYRVLGVNYILKKKYKTIEGLPEWVTDTFGMLPDPFHIQVIGMPKNGKTSLVMRLTHAISELREVLYVSKEEGDSSTVQEAYIRENMHERVGKVFLGDSFSFKKVQEYLRTGGGKKKKVVVLDSSDYLNLTKQQYAELISEFKKTSFVVISWGVRKGHEWKCRSAYGDQIKHMMGAVCGVENFHAQTIGRYGPTIDYTIWDKAPKQHNNQMTLFQNR